jgi:hypothetical protein
VTESSDNFPLWIIPVALPVFFVTLWCSVCYLLSFISGWRRLAAHYAATSATEGAQFLFRGGSLGPVSYRGALHFSAAADGLFIWVILPVRLGSPRLFIPWRDIAASMQKSWMVDYAVLTFAGAPGIKMRLFRRVADEIAAASRGGLRIAAG